MAYPGSLAHEGVRIEGFTSVCESLWRSRVITGHADYGQPVPALSAWPLTARLVLPQMGLAEASAFVRAEHPRVLSARWPSRRGSPPAETDPRFQGVVTHRFSLDPERSGRA